MHLHQLDQVAKAFIVLRLRDRAVLQEGIEQFLLLTEQFNLLPTLLGHKIRVPRADLAEQRHFDALGLSLVDESELFLHAMGLFVAVIIATPDAVHFEILKGIAEHLARGFGNEPLPPIWLANPIAELVFVVSLGKVVAVKTDAADRLAILFQAHGKGIGRGQNRSNDLTAVLHTRVRRPSGRWAYIGVACVCV